MADIGTFPTIAKVLFNNGPTWACKAGEAITAGQVVGFKAAGVSNTVDVMDATAGETAIGVALFTVATDEIVTVCLPGSICICVNADDTTGIDAGAYLEQNDNTVKGTVNEFTPQVAISTFVPDASNDYIGLTTRRIVGIVLEDIAGGATGKMLVLPQLIQQTIPTQV